MNARRISSTFLIASLTVATIGLGAANAEANDNGKKKKKQTTEFASLDQMLKKVDDLLLGYDTAGARELLEPATAKEKDPRLDVAMGRVLMLEQKYDQAVTKLAGASQQGGDIASMLYLGDAYAYARKRADADQVYQRVLQQAETQLAQKPGDADALYGLGVAQQRLKRYDQALQNLEQARAAKPKSEVIPFELGMTHMLRNEFQPAFDQLSRAIQLNSGFAYAYYYRALAAEKINRKDLVVNDMDRFLALAPTAPEAEKARRILQAARG